MKIKVAKKVCPFWQHLKNSTKCIKILQDEMRLRKMPEALISNCMNEYIKAFTSKFSSKLLISILAVPIIVNSIITAPRYSSKLISLDHTTKL